MIKKQKMKHCRYVLSYTFVNWMSEEIFEFWLINCTVICLFYCLVSDMVLTFF